MLSTQLFFKNTTIGGMSGRAFSDSQAYLDTNNGDRRIRIIFNFVTNEVMFFEYDSNNTQTATETVIYDGSTEPALIARSNGDSIVLGTGIYTFANNTANRFLTATIGAPVVQDLDYGSGIIDTNTVTNAVVEFAKAFKLKASDFISVNGIVQINPDVLSALTVDLNNIINNSIQTASLNATTAEIDNATINNLMSTTIDAADLTTANLTAGAMTTNQITVDQNGFKLKDSANNVHIISYK